MDRWQRLWDRVNDRLSEEFADGKISEEDVETILDECRQMDLPRLNSFCLENDYISHEEDPLE